MENPRWFSSSTTYPVFHQIHTPDGSYRNPPFYSWEADSYTIGLIPETTTEIVRNRIQPFIVDHIQIPQLTGTVTTDQIADSLLPVLTRKPIYTTGKTISTDKYKSQETKILPIVIASKALETDFSPVLIVRNTKTEPVKVRKASRKWHLGMGGGNFNIAGISSNSAGYPDYACNDHLQGNTPKPPLTEGRNIPYFDTHPVIRSETG